MEADENVIYRGEGIQNLVLANNKDKRVYRLRKVVQKNAKAGVVLDEQERSRRIHQELVNNVDYIKNVMRPLLTDAYVIIPKIIEIPKGFTEKVEDEIQHIRPAYRKSAEGVPTVDPATCSALVLPDLCFVTDTATCSCLSDTSKHASPTISVEIKPKKGFITLPSSSKDRSSVKYQVCKFCMHQRLKAKEGRWNVTSHYCPLDLFSGHKPRMKHALLALFNTPQNNLKICMNGEEVYSEMRKGDLGAVLDSFFSDDFGGLKNGMKKNLQLEMFLDLVIDALLSVPSQDETKLEHHAPSSIGILRDSIQNNCPPATTMQSHCPLVVSKKLPVQHCSQSSFISSQSVCKDVPDLPRYSVLERILNIQRLDSHDIEDVHSLYLKIKQATVQDCNEKLRIGSPFTSESWLSPCLDDPPSDKDSLEHAVSTVKRFNVSKTMQDCSVMLAIQRISSEERAKENQCQYLTDSQGRSYRFSVCIIDLDPKPVDKIQKHHELHCLMQTAFMESGHS